MSFKLEPVGEASITVRTHKWPEGGMGLEMLLKRRLIRKMETTYMTLVELSHRWRFPLEIMRMRVVVVMRMGWVVVGGRLGQSWVLLRQGSLNVMVRIPLLGYCWRGVGNIWSMMLMLMLMLVLELLVLKEGMNLKALGVRERGGCSDGT